MSRWPRLLQICGALFLVVLFTESLAFKGIPLLRHDWSWYRLRSDPASTLLFSTSGWATDGIGHYNVYSFPYPIAVIFTTLGYLTGPYGSFLLAAIAVSLLVLGASFAFDSGPGSNGHPLDIIVGAFLLLNPWVYTEIVAGHFLMVMSYAATAGIVFEAERRRRPGVLAALVIPLTGSIQFLVLGGAVLAFTCARYRLWLPALTYALAVAPEVMILSGARSSLEAVPYNATWETSQSLPPGSAPILSGYFTGYLAAFGIVPIVAMWTVVALAIVGAVVSLAGWKRFVLPIGLIAILIVTMGDRGPLGGLASTAFANFGVLSVFRELYDVIGLVAIGYAVLLRGALHRFSLLGIPAFAAIAVLAAYWIQQPAHRLWAGSFAVSTSAPHAACNARFLLTPPLQPLAYDDLGSGLDPDDFARACNQSPLNENQPLYPVDAAIGAYLRDGSTRALEGLSVDSIVDRPWFETQIGALSSIDPATFRAERAPDGAVRLAPLPELSLLSRADRTNDPGTIGRGAIFFADDLRAGEAFDPIPRPHGLSRASAGWVDPQLLFLEHPELGEPFGGAATTNATAPLALPASGSQLLVSVSGMLLDDRGRLLSRTTSGFAWIARPAGTNFARCRGRCLIVASGEPAVVLPPAEPAAMQRLAFSQPAPWLAITELPATASEVVLRYNVGFARDWIALRNGPQLDHVRLDAIVNGWRVPPAPGGRVVLVQVDALFAFVLQVIAVLWMTWVVVVLVGESLRSWLRRSRLEPARKARPASP